MPTNKKVSKPRKLSTSFAGIAVVSNAEVTAMTGTGKPTSAEKLRAATAAGPKQNFASDSVRPPPATSGHFPSLVRATMRTSKTEVRQR